MIYFVRQLERSSSNNEGVSVDLDNIYIFFCTFYYYDYYDASLQCNILL